MQFHASPQHSPAGTRVATPDEIATALSFLGRRYQQDHSGLLVLLSLGIGFLASYFCGSWLSSSMNLPDWAVV
jgi:hypothetical protein